MGADEYCGRCELELGDGDYVAGQRVCSECRVVVECGCTYDPFWVRQLVQVVGNELRDFDMLARLDPLPGQSAFGRGQSAGYEAAAGYLARAVRQSVEALGLTDVLEAARRSGAMTPQETP